MVADPFTLVFGVKRSTNDERSYPRLVDTPGLTVVMVKEEYRFARLNETKAQRDNQLKLGTVLRLRTQTTDKDKAVVSAKRQLKKKYNESFSCWKVQEILFESRVASE